MGSKVQGHSGQMKRLWVYGFILQRKQGLQRTTSLIRMNLKRKRFFITKARKDPSTICRTYGAGENTKKRKL